MKPNSLKGLVYLAIIANLLISVYSQDSKDQFQNLPGVSISSTAELDEITKTSDLTYLGFFYIKASKNSAIAVSFLQNIEAKLNYLAGIITVDCETARDFEICNDEKNDSDTFPRIVAFKPPQYKINPYTKKQESFVQIPYNQSEMTEKSLYNFLTQNIISKSLKLTKENFEQFTSDPNLNKVVLLTDKHRTGLIFKGLSCYFHNRIRFGELHKFETELIQKFQVEKYPAIAVLNSLEADLETPKESYEIVYYQGNLNALEIAEFISKYALQDRRDDDSKTQSTANADVNLFKPIDGNLEGLLEAAQKANRRVLICLDETKEVKDSYKRFAKQVNGFFSFLNLDCSKQSNSEICGKLNDGKQSKGYGTGDCLLLRKLAPSDWFKELLLLGKDYDGLVQDIRNEIQARVLPISSDNFQVATFQALNENKTPLIFLFEEDIDIVYHLLSSEGSPIEANFVFFALENPSMQIKTQTGATSLPNLVILTKDPNDPKQAGLLPYPLPLNYMRFRKFLVDTFTDEREAKAADDLSTKPRELIHVESLEVLQRECFSKRKVCVLALLDGRKIDESTVKSFESHVSLLNDLTKESSHKPYNYFYVNATCHEEFLAGLSLNVESLPNLVAYIPTKNMFSTLVGTFDKENINGYLNRVIKGRVPLQEIKEDRFVLHEKDCSKIVVEAVVEEDDDDIMREILEERRRMEEEEKRKSQEDKKKKKKKKKKKDL